jgi:hypothetical protein
MTTAAFTIDKGIPIPADIAKAVRHGRPKYPLELLTPGDSFFVKTENPAQSKNLRTAMNTRAKKLNITIVMLVDETGIRVWRTI